jgi:hypothetical protein
MTMQPRTSEFSARSAARTTCWYHSGKSTTRVGVMAVFSDMGKDAIQHHPRTDGNTKPRFGISFPISDSASLRQFPKSVFVFRHTALCDRHFHLKIPVSRNEPQNTLAFLNKAQSRALVSLQHIEHFLRQYNTQGISDLANFDLDRHPRKMVSKKPTVKRITLKGIPRNS